MTAANLTTTAKVPRRKVTAKSNEVVIKSRICLKPDLRGVRSGPRLRGLEGTSQWN